MLDVWVKLVIFQKTEDGRILINLSGLIRFEIKKEINNNKKYREFEVEYGKYNQDLSEQAKTINLPKAL